MATILQTLQAGELWRASGAHVILVFVTALVLLVWGFCLIRRPTTRADAAIFFSASILPFVIGSFGSAVRLTDHLWIAAHAALMDPTTFVTSLTADFFGVWVGALMTLMLFAAGFVAALARRGS